MYHLHVSIFPPRLTMDMAVNCDKHIIHSIAQVELLGQYFTMYEIEYLIYSKSVLPGRSS